MGMWLLRYANGETRDIQTDMLITILRNHHRRQTNNVLQGGHKVGQKNSPSFLGFSRAIITLFQSLLQQKVYVTRNVGQCPT